MPMSIVGRKLSLTVLAQNVGIVMSRLLELFSDGVFRRTYFRAVLGPTSHNSEKTPRNDVGFRKTWLVLIAKATPHTLVTQPLVRSDNPSLPSALPIILLLTMRTPWPEHRGLPAWLSSHPYPGTRSAYRVQIHHCLA